MSNTKILTFYLPQFHEIVENTEWWGEGFTEWTNVKKGKPIYKGHYQPKIPLENNYYNLLDIKVLENQAQLAKKYGVDGFCFYHYWFKGKKLLEKPLEMLLKNTQIDISYCLSWANETWSRRWTGEEKEILIKQDYGEEEDWKEHIDYFIQYFHDKRYLNIDNKPVLLLYRAFEIPKCEQMVKYWNRRLIEEGFDGIYIVETLNSSQKYSFLTSSDAMVEFEPMYTMHNSLNIFIRIYRYCFNHYKLSRIGFKDCLSYNMIFNKILKRNRSNGKKTFLGAFPAWDNTARKGDSGLVIKGSSPEKFMYYFEKQYKKSINLDNELIFINAWNEWGEGAYLEPDNKYNYSYLEAIKNIVSRIRGEGVKCEKVQNN